MGENLQKTNYENCLKSENYINNTIRNNLEKLRKF